MPAGMVPPASHCVLCRSSFAPCAVAPLTATCCSHDANNDPIVSCIFIPCSRLDSNLPAGVAPTMVVATAEADALHPVAAARASAEVAHMCCQLRQCVGQCSIQASTSGRGCGSASNSGGDGAGQGADAAECSLQVDVLLCRCMRRRTRGPGHRAGP